MAHHEAPGGPVPGRLTTALASRPVWGGVSGIGDWLAVRRGQMLADLQEFVERESPSTDKPRMDAFAEFVGGYGARMTGGAVEMIRQREWGDHVLLRVGEGTERPIFMVGHFDTVWPAGTLSDMPFRVEDGRAHGPGVFDMKAGLVQAFWALRALRETGSPHPPVVFLLNSDEEIGSPGSRPFIEERARQAALSMVLEPSFHGALKTARKGVGMFSVHVTGRASHAGSEPFEGVSAIEEACRITLVLHAETDRETGTTVNVGLFRGGTRGNVVAAEAELEVDLRVRTESEARRMTQAILGLRPHHPEARVQVSGGINRPPMERSPQVARLFEHARALAGELGIELQEASVGGGSDGNFCALVNPAVLDGLGAVGDGAHALSEHVLVDHMVPRAALVARLLQSGPPSLPPRQGEGR
jgi:glutamate carboxypeptidase